MPVARGFTSEILATLRAFIRINAEINTTENPRKTLYRSRKLK
jgi:hypothetical protein